MNHIISRSLPVAAVVLSMLALNCLFANAASSDSTLDAVEKALQAINSERGSISIVGRALTEQEKERLAKLEDAEEWVAKARDRLAKPNEKPDVPEVPDKPDEKPGTPDHPAKPDDPDKRDKN